MSVQWRSFQSGEEVPGNAIRSGQEAGGDVFYVARGTPTEGGGLNPGKFGQTTGRGVLFPAGGREMYTGKYELLVGDQDSVRWVDHEGRCDGNGLNLVEGGHEEDGTPLFIAQADYEGGTFPGKAGPKLSGCNIGYGGKEVTVERYRLLVHA